MTTCPTCGSRVRIHAADEGTQSYEPAPLDVEALGTAIRATELLSAEAQGVVFAGPPAEWYDAYAWRIAREYDRLTATEQETDR